MKSDILAGFDSVPLYTGSLIGFRSWYVWPSIRRASGFAWDGELRLHAAGFSTVWVPGVNTAECLKALAGCQIARGKVTDGCGHGFWAYSSTTDYLRTLQGLFGIWTVSGIVEGSGSAVVGPLGFRSMKARVLALGPVRRGQNFKRDYSSARDQLANYYDVPVFDSVKDLIAEFPLTDTKDFL